MWAGRYGMPKLDEMLRQWGAGRRTPTCSRAYSESLRTSWIVNLGCLRNSASRAYQTQFVPITRSGP